jgi:hypothetical protein
MNCVRHAILTARAQQVQATSRSVGTECNSGAHSLGNGSDPLPNLQFLLDPGSAGVHHVFHPPEFRVEQVVQAGKPLIHVRTQVGHLRPQIAQPGIVRIPINTANVGTLTLEAICNQLP